MVIIIASIFVIVALVLSGCTKSEPAPAPSPSPAPAPAPKPEPVTFKAVSFLPKNFASVHWMGEFIDRVNERSNGEVTIEWVGGPEVIPAFDQAQAVSTGVTDMTAVPAHWYMSLVPHTAVFIASELTPWEERENGFYDYAVEAHKTAGLAYMGRLDGNFSFYMYTNKKVSSPDGFVGMKMATGGAMIPAMEKLQMAGSRIDFAEIYTAVQQGVVDGISMVHNDCVDFKWYEVCDYWCDHGAYPASNEVLIVNQDKFSALSPEMQELMHSVVEEIEPEMYEFFGDREKEATKIMMENGMEPYTFSAADAERYLDVCKEARWDMLKENVSDDVYQTMRGFLTK